MQRIGQLNPARLTISIVTTKKKGKVNYIEQSSTTNNEFDDVSAGTDSCFLSSD